MNPSYRGVLSLSIFLSSGQIVIGVSKGYYCAGDGEVYEFGKGSGGGKVPVLNEDFTYTGNCEVISDSPDDNSQYNWRIKFYTSGTLTWLTNDYNIDVFLVGGGGSGHTQDISGGGGGGYTTTKKNIVISQNIEYPIVIGNGGRGPSTNYQAGNAGGDSTAFGYTGIRGSPAISSTGQGGDGGSGGGARYCDGGSDGSNGGSMTNGAAPQSGGPGQGTTTREFGENTGDLYSGGGGGYNNACKGDYNKKLYIQGDSAPGGGGYGTYSNMYGTQFPGQNGTANTGGGGGAGWFNGTGCAAGSGGSGIVIIRNHRE